MHSSAERQGLFRVAVMVEDPGAVNFLAPLVDRLVGSGVPTVVLGVGVGARMLRERGHAVVAPPDRLQVAEFVRTSRLSVVVVGTSEDPDTPAFPLIGASRAARVPTVGVVDASVNAAFRFRGSGDDALAHAPDWLMVPDEPTAAAFGSLGFPRDRVRLVGNPARDLARRRGWEIREAARAVVSGPRGHTGPLRVVFVAELSDGLDPGQYRRSDAYTLKGRGLSHSRTAVVAEELLDACAGLRDHGRLEMTLVLRLHPKQGRDDLGPLCDEFDEVSAGGDPLEVVATADLVVGMSSMLLIQADDIGVPCLSVLPREAERAWLPEVASGYIPAVTTRASLSAEIRRLLAASQVGRYRRDTSPPDGDPVGDMVECLAEASRGTPSP
jgi:hypothetical protein